MALLLAINERRPGVPLTEVVVPDTPVLTPTSGQNELTVAWSPASGGTAQEFVELRVAGDGGVEQFRELEINWGDGSALTKIGGLGKTFVEYPTHVYTGAGPYTIQVEATFRYVDITFNESLGITPDLSADWAYDQVRIEKLEDDVTRYAPDWKDAAKVPTTLLDVRVTRGFRYKYRVQLRTLDPDGAAAVVSSYSAQAVQPPWA